MNMIKSKLLIAVIISLVTVAASADSFSEKRTIKIVNNSSLDLATNGCIKNGNIMVPKKSTFDDKKKPVELGACTFWFEYHMQVKIDEQKKINRYEHSCNGMYHKVYTPMYNSPDGPIEVTITECANPGEPGLKTKITIEVEDRK